MSDEKTISSKISSEDVVAPEIHGESEYFIFNKKFLRVDRSNIVDEVDGVYKVNISSPLPQFDTTTSKAYSVTNKNDNSSDKLYAVILDKKYPVRLEEINKLIGNSCNNFCNVIAAQVISSSLGKGSFFTVIVERPFGIKLSEYIQNQKEIKESFIEDSIIAKISNVINFLVGQEIVHGKINLDNVYIDDKDNITVCECISDVCGVSQQILYENINRATCMPMGKGKGIVGGTDYYALGVLAAIMLRGKNPVAGIADIEVMAMKFSEGTYKIVADTFEFSPKIMDFLRGVLNDKSNEVWASKQINEWLNGRSFNLLPPGDEVDAGRPIVFHGKKYLSKKSLAQAFYLNWDEAKKFIREDVLLRWIERSVLDKELAEKMEVLVNRTGGGVSELFDKNDELLAQYIMLLDPYGPIRVKGFSAMIDGVGTLFAYGYANDKTNYTHAVENIIVHSLASYLSVDKIEKTGRKVRESVSLMQGCMELLRKGDIGFGLERCLYELNETLPCQSPALQAYSVFTMNEVLKVSNSVESIGSNIVDRHIAAFLSSRLELTTRVRITSLVRFADFASNLHIQMLSLLALAQEVSGIKSLNKLSVKIVDALKNVVDEFHSKYVREDINKDLSKVATKGNLPDILKIITDTQYLVRDRLGFRKAVTRYRNNKINIIKLGNRKAVNNMGYRYGLHLSVLLSFFLTTVVVVILVIKAF